MHLGLVRFSYLRGVKAWFILSVHIVTIERFNSLEKMLQVLLEAI